MAYTCNLLLRTLPAIEHEVSPEDPEPRIIIDMLRPDRDELAPPSAVPTIWPK